MSESAPDFNPLRLPDDGIGLTLRIGEVDLSYAHAGGDITSSLNDIPEATFSLRSGDLAGLAVDYFGVLEIAKPDGPHRFDGEVITARPENGLIRLVARTHAAMKDSVVSPMEAVNCDHRELVHLLARSAGLPDSLINIHGFDELPLEVVEVFIPISGLSVGVALPLGAMTVLPTEDVAPLVGSLNPSDLRDDFASGDAYVVYRRVGRHMLNVEEEALREVDVLLAWVTARARYGLALLPDGQPQEFSRTVALRRPTASTTVVARGLDTGRLWLRQTRAIDPPGTTRLGRERGQDWVPPIPADLSVPDRLGLLALHRAVSHTDPLQRVAALWEAVEFYAAGVATGAKFDATEARRVRKAIPKDVAPELRQRALDLLGMLNEPPLMARLREAANRQRVPLTENEMDLLKRVRTVRNDAVHGRSTGLPDPVDVDVAVSVVARLLLHRLAGPDTTPPIPTYQKAASDGLAS